MQCETPSAPGRKEKRAEENIINLPKRVMGTLERRGFPRGTADVVPGQLSCGGMTGDRDVLGRGGQTDKSKRPTSVNLTG